MDAATNKQTVLLGVTGGVAIYKACEVIRQLQKLGVRVKVVMTEHATHFIDPTLFRSLTREPVGVGLFDNPADPIHHISLAKEADVFCIAPCTANVAAKIAHGIADDLLTTTALATQAPLVLAPAMNTGMYENVATQENLALLRARGVRIVEADSGYLACGDTGKGKLAPVERIVEAIVATLADAAGGENAGCDAGSVPAGDLQGREVLVTAGPTHEYIDAVRYISNPSTGKMGYALAQAAAARGAHVTLVAGPCSLPDPEGVRTVHVESAQQMAEAAEGAFPGSDIAVFTAAVSDYRPAVSFDRKLKKGVDDAALAHIDLVANPDILASCAAAKAAGQVVVGFAAETSDLAQNAKAKLASKRADMIVANLVGEGGAFGADGNEALLVYGAPEDPQVRQLEPMAKRTLADVILSKALELQS